MTALTDAASRTIALRETLVLSAQGRAAFFEALIDPAPQSERLRRAFAEPRRRVARDCSAS